MLKQLLGFMMSDLVTVITPMYNSGKYIEETLNSVISQTYENWELFIIDDGSSDSTFELALKRSDTIKLPKNLGIGGAVQTGIKYAFEAGYDICIQLDGDGQHPPEEVKKMLTFYQKNKCSVVIGSRYLDENGFQSSLMRRFGSKLISLSLKSLAGSIESFTDPTSGFRLMDRSAMAVFSKHYPIDFPEPISLAWALRKNIAVLECSINMKERIAGKSSISSLKAIIYMIRVLCYIQLSKFKTPF